MNTIRFSLFRPLALSLVIGVGCGEGTELSAPELEVGEAASYLEVSEETDGAAAEDAVAGMDEGAVEDFANEDTDRIVDARHADRLGPCDFLARRARIRAAYDADGSGDLDEAERDQLRSDVEQRDTDSSSRLRDGVDRLRRRVFHRVRWAYDVDGNGELDTTERASLVDATIDRCQARRDRVLAAFDADGNGELDSTELEAFRRAMRARLEARRAAILERYDANGNGALEDEERRAWQQDVREHWMLRRERIRNHFDVDGDGILSDAELDALKAAIRDRYASAGEESTTTDAANATRDGAR